MRGIVGKFIRGAAAAGVPMLDAEHKANIMAARDAKLQSYGKENMATQQGYAVENREDTQAHQTTLNDSNQEFQSSERIGGESFTAEQNNLDRDLDRSRIGIEEDKLALATEQAKIAMESSKLGLVQQQQLQSLYDTILDPEADDEARDKAADDILKITGKSSEDRYSAVYEDIKDESGYPTGGRNTFILNNRTGQAGTLRFGNAGSDGQYATPEDVRDAMNAGTITREQAIEELRQFQ